MIALIIGLLLGALVAVPLIPLLRVTDVAVGRAAAGVAMIAVVAFAFRFWVTFRDVEGAAAADLAGALAQVLTGVWPVYAVALVIAALGTFVRARA
jgi:hypothetical protein